MLIQTAADQLVPRAVGQETTLVALFNLLDMFLSALQKPGWLRLSGSFFGRGSYECSARRDKQTRP